MGGGQAIIKSVKKMDQEIHVTIQATRLVIVVEIVIKLDNATCILYFT